MTIATGDADQDGLSNLVEYFGGSSPRLSSSVFHPVPSYDSGISQGLVSQLAACYPPGSPSTRSVGDPLDWNIALDYTHAVSTLANPVPQEIKELVRGSENDPKGLGDAPKRIFEFVRNH